jgi:BirA family biotin operon repressor/biotin-[acetyl-CoA-carboxylase] ligase
MLGTLFIGQNHISLASVDSTNSFAKDLLTKEHPAEGTIISATTQLKGRGQAGNTWAAEGGKNLTVSYILYPNFLEAAQQFYLNMAISLAVKDCCEEQTGGEFSIKWPNDIYYGDRKVAGILIENTISGSSIASSVVGIGLNANQEEFDENLPNPVALAEISKLDFDLNKLRDSLSTYIEKYYLQLRQKHYNFLDKAYTVSLYRYQQTHEFKKGTAIIKGEINGVTKEGKLILHSQGKEHRFAFKEVEFVI